MDLIIVGKRICEYAEKLEKNENLDDTARFYRLWGCVQGLYEVEEILRGEAHEG